ncbi:MAG: alpha/beta hydrolase [Bacteroidota bacterium]
MKKTNLIPALLLAATIHCSGQPSPLAEGIWLGTLKLNSIELRLGITISGSEEGTLKAVLTSIDQGGAEIPMDQATLFMDTLSVESAALGLKMKGAVDVKNGTWDTQFKQGPVTLPLTMYKVEHLPALNRSQEPHPPYPYLTEEVKYENSGAGIRIAGTLTLPEGGGPFPAVILLTGSGPQNRDEEIFGHKPFWVLADYLTRNGIVVLRSDDRGVGGTSGDFALSTTDDFSGDALAGVAFLKTRGEVKQDLIGLAGHSEGGMIAPLAATRSDDVGFIVLMAAPAIPFDQIVLFQKRQKWEMIGMSEADMELNTRWHNKVAALVASDLSDVQVGEEMRKLYRAFSEDEHKRMYKDEAALEQEIGNMVSPWWRFACRYDAVSTLKKIRCPVLAINGEKDMQVQGVENLAAIEAALAPGDCPGFDIKPMPGLNHLFQTALTGDESEYGKIEETFSPEAMEVIAAWILKLDH